MTQSCHERWTFLVDLMNICTCHCMYCQSYFEALDFAINAIQDRFDQPHFCIYHCLETPPADCSWWEYTRVIWVWCQFYKGKLDKQQLQLHLETLQAIFPEDVRSTTLCIKDLKQFILVLSENECVLIGEVVTLLKFILIIPCTNAVNKHSFSAMREVKAYMYLWTTMTQQHFNHLLLLHIHVNLDPTDGISCLEVEVICWGLSPPRFHFWEVPLAWF